MKIAEYMGTLNQNKPMEAYYEEVDVTTLNPNCIEVEETINKLNNLFSETKYAAEASERESLSQEKLSAANQTCIMLQNAKGDKLQELTEFKELYYRV